jgi:DNA-binding response OmpR family regulator
MYKKILVIDDDKNTLTYIKYSLKTIESALNENIILDTAGTIEEAEHYISSNKYDLIITDYMIGGCPADDLICKIKESETKTYKVMTAIRDITKFRELLESGVSQIIYKPFSWYDILGNMSDTITLKTQNVS